MANYSLIQLKKAVIYRETCIHWYKAMEFLSVLKGSLYRSFKNLQESRLVAGVLFLENDSDAGTLPLPGSHTEDRIKGKAEERNKYIEKLRNTEDLGRYLERVVLHSMDFQIRDQSYNQGLILMRSVISKDLFTFYEI